MSFSINTNISSLQAQNYLEQSSKFQSQTINEVTSGLRIVNSGDDAAGLAIANGYRSDEAVLTQGIQNANDALATLQTVDGGMNNISTLLDRASTLATESASGTFTGNRSTLNEEFQSVIGEINRQAQAIGMTQGGQFAKNLSVFIGGGEGSTNAAATANGSINLDLTNSTVDAQSLGLQGVQATGNTSVDIGTGSANTSVQDILANTANTNSEKNAGYTTFTLSGAGFSGSNAISLSVNLAGVTDANTLTTAINSAIESAGNGNTQSATALKNADITASIVTNASGQSQLAFSSSQSAFQVQAGDQTANALLGNLSQNAALTGAVQTGTINTTTNHTLAFKFDGSNTAQTITLGTNANDTVGNIANELNQDSTFKQYAKATVQNNQLVVTSLNNSSTSAVAVTTGGLATTLFGTNLTASAGSASTGAPLTTTVSSGIGAATSGNTAVTSSDAIQVKFSGAGMSSPVTLTVNTTSGTTTQAQVLAALQSQVANNSALAAAGITLSSGLGAQTGTVAFSDSQGQQFQVAVTGDSENLLGFGSFSADSNGNFDYTSIKGTAALPSATGSGSGTLDISLGGGASTQLTVDESQIGLGSNSAQQDVVNQINAQIANSNSLSAAGLQASLSSGKLVLSSSNGTSFRVSGGGTDNLGFGTSGGAYAGSTFSGTPNSSSRVDSAGAYTSGALAFSGIATGADNQSVAITATDASGNSHSLSVSLQNNATNGNTSGDNIDDAINAINKSLQQSNDSTLQSIVAVKENVNGQSAINFQSTTQNFKVAVSSLSDGSGITPPTSGIATAKQNGTGSDISIDTVSGAEAAVNALSTAVQSLGTAQAAVGKGENLLNYATSLAQSQDTAAAASESDIRDANLAQEAANLTKAQILVQAGTAALSQANSAPQQLLSLLQGH